VLVSDNISTNPIFLLGYANINYSLRLLMEQSPFGFGHVSIDSNILKSARLKTNILV
jgi:hypothetical protein